MSDAIEHSRRWILVRSGYVEAAYHATVLGSDVVTIEPCQACAASVTSIDMWQLVREPAYDRVGFTHVVAMPDIELCCEVQPCGHDVPQGDDGISYWVNADDGGKPSVTWQKRTVPT